MDQSTFWDAFLLAAVFEGGYLTYCYPSCQIEPVWPFSSKLLLCICTADWQITYLSKCTGVPRCLSGCILVIIMSSFNYVGVVVWENPLNFTVAENEMGFDPNLTQPISLYNTVIA